MPMTRIRWQPMLLPLVVLLLLAACGGQPAAPAAPAPAAPAPEAPAMTDAPAATGGDLLADVESRGVLRISTDSNYAPQSFLNPDGSWEGFDVEVGREVARRLGVEPEFLDINFDVITAGSWNNRWDINVGSMTVTAERREVLAFTQPYYFTPAAFAVHANSSATSVADLEGKKIGLGAATTYLNYMEGTLTLEGEEILVPPPAAEVQVYDTDLLAVQDLALGDGTRLDAVITALPTIDNAIKEGLPIKVLGTPVYYEALAVVLDKSSALPIEGLQARIDAILDEMHSDGTLTRLSEQFYGVDITKKVQ